jgi:tripeptide aminopeptidase
MKKSPADGMEFNACCLALETPTAGWLRGLLPSQEMSGKREKSTMVYIIRDHSMGAFQERKAAMAKAPPSAMIRAMGKNSVVWRYGDQFYNMYGCSRRMVIVHLAEEAMKAAGIPHPTTYPIRARYAGLHATFKGVLCPNLPSAATMPLGRFDSMGPLGGRPVKTGVRTLSPCSSPELVERVIVKKRADPMYQSSVTGVLQASECHGPELMIVSNRTALVSHGLLCYPFERLFCAVSA